MSSSKFVDNYPGERTTTETTRLHAQHDLVAHAFGGEVLCPLDTSQKGLSVLDIGTADGWWLHCVRKKLTHPETAELIGTDIAPYPDAVEQVQIQDFREAFNADWHGKFDIVQLRAVMASAGSAAIDVVRRALELVKSGGYIQLVDSSMPFGDALETDKPSIQFFKRVGNLLVGQGMVPDQGARITEILRGAGTSTIMDQTSTTGRIQLGKGSDLESTSWTWIKGMTTVVGNGLIKMQLIEEARFDELQLAVLEEAKNEGIEIEWYATWARKT